MNFYSHIAVASLFTEDRRVALGAVLPDLASLVGAKPPRTDCPRLRRGYALHHATDRIFHAVDPFRRAEVAESQELQRLGMRRGTARATAHVGLEIVLDEALADDVPTRQLLGETLISATPEALGQYVKWSADGEAAHFEALRQRLWTLTKGLPPPLNATLLAERLSRTLEHRPKLAVRADDRAILNCWADGVKQRWCNVWPDVMAQVVSDLSEAHWYVSPALSRQLRFRRASSNEV